MNNQKSIPLDDVLDYYSLSSLEIGIDILPEMVKQYPEYEQDLRELSAFRHLQESMPERTYTVEEETALKDRAVGIVKAILHDTKQLQNAGHRNHY